LFKTKIIQESPMVINKESIAIIGGTGKEGKGLALRWAKSGYQVTIGSRNLEKAEAARDELNGILKNHIVSANTNEKAAQSADIIVFTVPYSAHKQILESLKPSLQGKTIIDVTVPLVPPQISSVKMPMEGSASQEAQHVLGPGCKIVSAFQNISYDLLMRDSKIDCDVLVCATDDDAKIIGLRLVEDAGLIGWDAGPIENSVVVEGMTSILIGLNKKYGSKNAGIKITGITNNFYK